MTKALKIGGIALAAVAAMSVAFSWLGAYWYDNLGPGDPPLAPLEQQVQQRLQNKLAQGAKEIQLAQLVDFPWDKACTLQPYTDKAILNKAAGGRLQGYGSIGWIDNEAYWTLAFVSGDELKAVRIPIMAFGRYTSGGAFVECAPRADAVLTYHTQPSKEIPPRAFYLTGRQR